MAEEVTVLLEDGRVITRDHRGHWVLRDPDGRKIDNLLLFGDVAGRAGVKPATIKTYNAKAEGKRLRGTWTVHDLPEPVGKVPVGYVKGDGHRGGSRSPAWAEAEIGVWLGNRLGPGGVLRRPPQDEDEDAAAS